MKTVDLDYLDSAFTIQYQAPATVAELVPVLGTEDDVVDYAVDTLMYRNKYPRDYKAVSKAVIERHGFARKVVDTKKNKDGTQKDVLESENDHLRRFLKGDTDDDGNIVSPAPEENEAILRELFVEIAGSSPLYVEGEGRRGGGGKVSAANLELANKLFAANKTEEAVSKIEEAVPGYKIGRDGDGNVTIESLARGVQAMEKEAIAKAKRTAAAGLGL